MRASKPSTGGRVKLPELLKFDKPKPRAPQGMKAPEKGVKRCDTCHEFMLEYRNGERHECRFKCTCFEACPTKYVTGVFNYIHNKLTASTYLSLGHPTAHAEYKEQLCLWSMERDAWDKEQQNTRDEERGRQQQARDEKSHEKEVRTEAYNKRKLKSPSFKVVTKDMDDKYL